jgi:hypothetical protein
LPKNPEKGYSSKHFLRENMEDIFSMEFSFLAIAASGLIALFCPLPGEVGDTGHISMIPLSQESCSRFQACRSHGTKDDQSTFLVSQRAQQYSELPASLYFIYS